MSVVVKKYRPHLPTLMTLFEVNYMLLLRVLADKEQVGEQRCFFISDFLSYRVRVDEVTKYTTLLTINQEANIQGYNLTELFRPKMVIRLYHDARMAEVISNQDVQQIKPRYDYPNNKMHLPDEKQQINYFLKEWLQLCLQLGQVQININILKNS
ncbi:DUF1249 domain-containing protein [Colwellia sp. C1TZA3]|uniref:DUF1249 domain-containing protein n=1 Tax=Colwellia sp. C1TZA3 TaxID=2508879 RepID=UPI0011B9C6C9|nr:DUF1249 domain-containing protein [Colwellia sp. C1TZA3]TWX70408.1 DUF1249 domain-containing protein [Colwellia sp. C1TZA3]